MKIALIIGGAESTMAEYVMASNLLNDGYDWSTFVINDMIAVFPDHINYAITLHPDKLPKWAHDRNQNKLSEPDEVWAHRPTKLVTHNITDWGGSSGLFAVKIALEKKYTKIILCGVPMDVQSGHFIRHQPWDASHAFRRGWNTRMATIRPFVRSFGGWTLEQLGPVTIEWINS